MKKLIAALALAGLTACSTIGSPSPDTFNEKVVVGYQAVEVLAHTAMTLRIQGQITAAQKDSYAQRIQEMEDALVMAQTMHQTDPAGAQTKLALIIAALSALQAELAAQGH